MQKILGLQQNYNNIEEENMKKLSCLFAALIIILVSVCPAFADECLHGTLELAGPINTRVVNLDNLGHEVQKYQYGYCTFCGKAFAVIISKTTEAHTWASNGDTHLNNGKHIYYYKCTQCNAQASQTKACGGIHTRDGIGDILQ